MIYALEAIQSNDMDKINELLVPQLELDSKTVNDMKQYISGKYMESHRVGYYYNVNMRGNGDKTEQWSIQYKVKTGEGTYFIDMDVVSHNKQPMMISGYHITSQSDAVRNQKANKRYNFATMNSTQFALFIYYILQWGLVILSIVVCIKSKIRLKWLWIIVIVLGCMGIAYSASSNGFRFNLLLLGIPQSYLILGSVKAMVFTLPVGSILFLLIRKYLTKQYSKMQERMNEDKRKKGA